MNKEFLLRSLKKWQPTRNTLHYYSKAVSVMPRAHTCFRPKWWCISFKVVEDGLITVEMPKPEIGSFFIKMNLVNRTVEIISFQDQSRYLSIAAVLASSGF